ncbi:MAG: mechanosensitive ion channel family protein [Polyangiales bacterium]
MTLDSFYDTLLHGEGVIAGSVLLVAGLAIALVLRSVVDVSHRVRLRTPTQMLVAGGLLLIALDFAWLPPRLAHWFSFLPVALLLLGYGRLLSVAIFDYLMGRRFQTQSPRILRDIVDGLFSALALLITLGALGVEPGSLLTTSAVLTAVLGLSLQDTLGNLFAGLALQAQRPFGVGDWIQIDRDGTQIGRVVEINWRATRLLTGDSTELTIPNNQLARSVILNHSHSDFTHRHVRVVLPYELPTQRVHALLLRAIEGVDGIRSDPPPKVHTQDFTDQGVQYALRFCIREFSQRTNVEAAVRDRIWYMLQRNHMSFATAPRGASLELPEVAEVDQPTRAAAIRNIDFLRGLPDAAIEILADGSHTEQFAPGELVVKQGETGEDLYLCLHGELQVLHQPEQGPQREIARLTSGGLFGEIAQLTGQARAASVRALTPCELVVVGKPAFVQVLTENPALADSISERLAQQRAELDALERAPCESPSAVVDKHKRQFLQRIREFFLA